MGKKRLFVDMDGTLARFHDEANYLERMYEEDFFFSLRPFDNMVSGIREFMKNHPDVEVFVLSAKVMGSPYCTREKNLWLHQHLPEIDAEHRIFTDMGVPKANYIPGGVTRDDYLLDDYNKGLNEFLYAGGSAVKCHNNINQHGKGTHGGSAGKLWVGPMVHTEDTPAMISAELSQHMGLEYDIEHVVQSIPGEHQFVINPQADGSYFVTEGHQSLVAHNLLDAVRFLSGKPDFKEIPVLTRSGGSITSPHYQLCDIHQNLYGTRDYSMELRYSEAERAFGDEVARAQAHAQNPIVGQIDYLHTDGRVRESAVFYSFEEMNKEIQSRQDYGVPISVNWFIKKPERTINDFKDLDEIADFFYYDKDLDAETSYAAARALVTPFSGRTPQQMSLLMDLYQKHNLPGELHEFLRITKEELLSFQSKGKKKSLGSQIRAAESKSQSGSGSVPGKPKKKEAR